MKRLYIPLVALALLTPVLAQQEGTAEVNLYDHLNRHVNPNAAITGEGNGSIPNDLKVVAN